MDTAKLKEDLMQLHASTVSDNVDYLLEFEKKLSKDSNINEAFLEYLTLSSKSFTEKWKAEKKHLRTRYAIQAIPDYPKNITLLSVSIDSIINALDDLLDETLTKDEKALYIVEMIRVMSLKSLFNLSKEMAGAISDYFNKILLVAISEAVYKQVFEKEKDIIERFNCGALSYKSRSIDVDIFFDIPLIELGYSKKDIDIIMNAARSFRVMNLASKDLLDFEHDKKNQNFNLLIMLYNDGVRIQNFIDYLYKSAKEDFPKSKDKRVAEILANLENMLETEKKKFDEALLKRI
jgi:hypothetical protein